MAANPQTLMSEAKCFACYGVTTVQLMRLAILARTLTTLDPMAATDPQSLLEYAKCFNCFSEAGLSDLMELALLDQISASSTVIVSSNNISGAGSPVGVVTPTAINQFYRDETGDALWQSTGLTDQDWLNWI